MKIIYCASRWPWPTNLGRHWMIVQSLRYCLELGDTHLVAFAEQHETPDHPIAARLKDITCVPDASGLETIYSAATKPFRPLQSHMYDSHEGIAKLISVIERVQPDVVIFDMLRSVLPAKAVRRRFPNLPIVLDMDDTLSLRYERMLQNGNLDIASTFVNRLHPMLRFFAKKLPQLLLWVERILMHREEARLAKTFDGAMLISPPEAAALMTRLPAGFPVASVPPAVKLSRKSPAQRQPLSRIIFLGNALYYANAEALLIFDKIATEVTRIVGKDNCPSFEAAGVPNPNLKFKTINFLGYVEDLAAFLNPIDAILVAPIQTGTGVKIKIIDAIAEGLPLLTTAVGAASIDIDPDKHFFQCESEQDFIDTIVQIISGDISGERLAEMAISAQEHLSEVQSEDVVSRQFTHLLEDAIASRKESITA